MNLNLLLQTTELDSDSEIDDFGGTDEANIFTLDTIRDENQTPESVTVPAPVVTHDVAASSKKGKRVDGVPDSVDGRSSMKRSY